MADRTFSILYCPLHYNYNYKTMFFLFNSVLYVPNNYRMAKEEKGKRCDLKRSITTK